MDHSRVPSGVPLDSKCSKVYHMKGKIIMETSNNNSRTPRAGAKPAVDAEPITQLEIPRTVATGGRPKKLRPMPVMEGMSDVEQVLFDDFIREYLDEYPDITPTDYRMLFLVAVEYIKYLRIVSKELATGTVLSMARQHPGTNMRALQDQLSFTRKARMHGKAPANEDEEKLREFLFDVGKN